MAVKESLVHRFVHGRELLRVLIDDSGNVGNVIYVVQLSSV